MPPGASWTGWRRATQLAVGAFYLALPVLHAHDQRGIIGNLASLRLGPVDLTEPAAGLSAALAGRTLGLTLLLGLLPVIGLALALGPVFCSWLCPWGALSEGIDAAKQRLGPREWAESSWVRVRWARHGSLASFGLGSLLLGAPLAALLSAPRLISALPREAWLAQGLPPVTGGLLLGLLVVELVGPRRRWCRALCPVGALANQLRLPSTLVTFVTLRSN